MSCCVKRYARAHTGLYHDALEWTCLHPDMWVCIPRTSAMVLNPFRTRVLSNIFSQPGESPKYPCVCAVCSPTTAAPSESAAPASGAAFAPPHRRMASSSSPSPPQCRYREEARATRTAIESGMWMGQRETANSHNNHSECFNRHSFSQTISKIIVEQRYKFICFREIVKMSVSTALCLPR